MPVQFRPSLHTTWHSFLASTNIRHLKHHNPSPTYKNKNNESVDHYIRFAMGNSYSHQRYKSYADLERERQRRAEHNAYMRRKTEIRNERWDWIRRYKRENGGEDGSIVYRLKLWWQAREAWKHEIAQRKRQREAESRRVRMQGT